MIKMPTEGDYARLKTMGEKIKSRLIIYEDFESILVPKDNGK